MLSFDHIGGSSAPAAISEPPEFSLAAFIGEVIAELQREYRSKTLDMFDLDTTIQNVQGIWRPNLLHKCRRKQVYKAARVEREAPMAVSDVQQQVTFDRGHVFEAWTSAYVRKLAGRFGFGPVKTAGILYDPVHQIGGIYDILLERDGHLYLVEVKSKENPYRWPPKIPEENHRFQLNDYMGMSIHSPDAPDIRAGWVLYVGMGFVGDKICPSCGGGEKASLQWTDFFHRFDRDLWKETTEEVDLLEWFLYNQSKLAPKTHKKWFECKGCPYAMACQMERSPAVLPREKLGV